MAQIVLHKKSHSVNQDLTPVAPLPSELLYGEIAINYAAGHETIFLKNDNDVVIALPTESSILLERSVGANTIVPKNSGCIAVNPGEVAFGTYNDTSTGTSFSIGVGDSETPRNAIEVKDDGSLFLQGVSNYDGTNSDSEGVGCLQDYLEQTEYVVSAAINDLNDRLTVVEGNSDIDDIREDLLETLTGVSVNGTMAQVVGRVALIDASSGPESPFVWYSDGDNEPTGITINNENLDLYTTNEGEVAIGRNNNSNDGTMFSVGVGSGSTYANAIEVMDDGGIYVYGIGDYDGGNNISSAQTLQQYLDDNEYVVAQTLNDLNDRVSDCEDAIDSMITGVTVNNSSVPVTNGVAAITVPNNFVTSADVATAIANLVDSAPATLDTLNELAAALGDDPNFATTVTNMIAQRLSGVTINSSALSVSNGVASISGLEVTSNKVTSMTSASTDNQYPTAKAVYDAITDNEYVTSAALTDISSKLISGVTMNSAAKTVTNGVVDLGTVVTAQTQLSTGATQGSGNVVTSIAVSNHQITMTKDITIPAWATASTKPSYTAAEVGAMATSERSNYLTTADTANFITSADTGWFFIRLASTYQSSCRGTGGAALPSGTYNSIASALSNGQVPVIVFEDTNLGYSVPYYCAIDLRYDGDINFFAFPNDTNLLSYEWLRVLSNDNGRIISYSIGGSGLPAVTASDNGKILRVVNGAWTLVDPITVYTGNSTPSSSLGQDGDIYLQTDA